MGGGIEPEGVIGGVYDDGHAVVDGLYQLVAVGGEDGA